MKITFFVFCQYTHGVTRRLFGPHDTLPCVLISVVFLLMFLRLWRLFVSCVQQPLILDLTLRDTFNMFIFSMYIRPISRLFVELMVVKGLNNNFGTFSNHVYAMHHQSDKAVFSWKLTGLIALIIIMAVVMRMEMKVLIIMNLTVYKELMMSMSYTFLTSSCKNLQQRFYLGLRRNLS